MISPRHLAGRSRLVVAVLATSFLFTAAPSVEADESGWPREVESDEARIVMYQPQPESFEGNQIKARAAMGVTPKGRTEAVYGVVWMEARVETDKDAGVVHILGVNVTDVRFPEGTDEHKQKLKALIEREVPTWELEVSYDQLVSSLAVVDEEAEASGDLKTDPPAIVFMPEPAVLLLYDGEPQLRDIEQTKYQRVINTAQAVVYDPKAKTYYLSGGDVWYSAKDAKGPWQHMEQPPTDIAALVPKQEDERAGTTEDISTAIPGIVVATAPTELIVAQGEPAWTPIEGTNLLFMSNSESDVLMDVNTQDRYVLISGRWYHSKSLEGPWSYVASDQLPAEFADIPYESANGHLLMYVAGTDQAREATMDAQIPETQAVSRENPALSVEYDGKPDFQTIEGTDMLYAVNTAFSVIQDGHQYYCCHEGVWYVSSSPNGPWAVATTVPSSIQTIPPSCPVYNVKYVYVYDYTPSVVYVGYTSGYMGGYVYGPTIVYGTGWYYPPYWGPRYYYPRPYTYGFSVRYNPYYGWSFGFSYSSGPFHMTFVGGGRPPYGYWGPRPYHPYPYRSYNKTNINVNRNININTGDINVGRQPRRDNVYDRPENRKRNAERPVTADRKQPRASNEKNNVLADRDGNVHRRTDKGWESRQNGSWQPNRDANARPGGQPQARPAQPRPSQPSARPSQPSSKPQARPSQRPNQSKQQQLNRDYQARQRGAQRSSRGGGGRGGGRRR